MKLENEKEKLPNYVQYTSSHSQTSGNGNDIKLIMLFTGRKRKRCGECVNCQLDDCGQCKFCKDKHKFGGPNVKKQCCIKRKCLSSGSNPVEKDKTVQLSALPLDLKSQRRTIHYIQGDGNCLFRALAHIIYGNELFHLKMRQILVEFTKNNEDILKYFVLSGTFSDHLEQMKNDRVWGTQVELYAAATLFMLPIYVYTPKRDTYNWIVYQPRSSSNTITYSGASHIATPSSFGTN